MINRLPSRTDLSPLGVALNAWLVDGVDLQVGDEIIYWELRLPILSIKDGRAYCHGWPAGFRIESTNRWPIVPRKEPARA